MLRQTRCCGWPCWLCRCVFRECVFRECRQWASRSAFCHFVWWQIVTVSALASAPVRSQGVGCPSCDTQYMVRVPHMLTYGTQFRPWARRGISYGHGSGHGAVQTAEAASTPTAADCRAGVAGGQGLSQH
jgi:hypothetical protein